MSDLERRGGSRPSRKQRDRPRLPLVLATGAFGLVGALGLVLSIVGILSVAGWSIIALIIAAICFALLRAPSLGPSSSGRRCAHPLAYGSEASTAAPHQAHRRCSDDS